MKYYEVENGIMIYYLPCELDHYAAENIKKKSEAVFADDNVKYLIFDFEKTNFNTFNLLPCPNIPTKA